MELAAQSVGIWATSPIATDVQPNTVCHGFPSPCRFIKTNIEAIELQYVANSPYRKNQFERRVNILSVPTFSLQGGQKLEATPPSYFIIAIQT